MRVLLFGLPGLHWLNEMCKSLLKTSLRSEKALCLKIVCRPIICPNENLGIPASTAISVFCGHNGDNKISLKPEDTGICSILLYYVITVLELFFTSGKT